MHGTGLICEIIPNQWRTKERMKQINILPVPHKNKKKLLLGHRTDRRSWIKLSFYKPENPK